MSAAQHISGTATAASFNLFSKTAYQMHKLQIYWQKYTDHTINIKRRKFKAKGTPEHVLQSLCNVWICHQQP